MAAFIARNEALVPALEQLGLLVEAVEGGVVVAEAVEVAETLALAKRGNTIKNVTLAHAEVVAEAVGGGIELITKKGIEKGFKITLKLRNGETLMIRLMNEGCGGRPVAYYRVIYKSKDAMTLAGVLSNNAKLTHIDLNPATYIQEIIKIVKKANDTVF